MSKTIILGLDGATWEILDEYLDELPNLKKLKEKGAYGELTTVRPPGTIPGWNCITTGLNPGKLATSFFFEMGKERYDRPYQSETSPEIWDYLSKKGKQCCVISVPTTRNPYPINGTIIAGFLATSKKIAYPETAQKKIEEIGYDQTARVDTDQELGKAVKKLTERQEKIWKTFHNEKDDFSMIVYVAPDRLQHTLLKYLDPKHPFYSEKNHEKYEKDLLENFKQLDKILGKINTNKINLFIVSDHGFRSCRRNFNITDWLVKNNYLKLKNKKNIERKTRFSDTLLGIAKKLHILDLMPKKLVSRKLLKKLRPERKTTEKGDIIDWQNTTVYPYGAYGRLRVNLKNREQNGIVEEKNYKKTKKEIKEKLEKIKGLTITDSHDLYHGKNIMKVADLFVEVDNYRGLVNTTPGHKGLWSDSTLGGCHAMNGIFLAAGPDIAKKGRIDPVSVLDIAPTTLHLMNMEIDENMDGKVIKVFKKNSKPGKTKPKKKKYKIKKSQEQIKHSKKEEEEVKKRLEALGYL